MTKSEEMVIAETLKQFGEMTTSQVSDTSNIAYSKTYRILKKLNKWDFIECLGRSDCGKGGNPALSWKIKEDTSLEEIKERYHYIKVDG